MKIPHDLFRNYRFTSEIIQYAVWLYFVFPLSFRDVELLLYERGIRTGQIIIICKHIRGEKSQQPRTHHFYIHLSDIPS